MKQILVINTGGTIGMMAGDKGLYPTSFISETCLDLGGDKYVDMDPLIDSSQLAYQEMNTLVDMIFDYEKEYDGFLLLTGTDTMAYIYHYLKWMLPFLKKPIIITGSLTPVSVNPGEGKGLI